MAERMVCLKMRFHKESLRAKSIYLVEPEKPRRVRGSNLASEASVPSACPVEDSGSTRHLFSPSPKNLELPGRHGLFTSNQFLISARNASRCSTAQ